jgi:hypothetical protein
MSIAAGGRFLRQTAWQALLCAHSAAATSRHRAKIYRNSIVKS